MVSKMALAAHTIHRLSPIYYNKTVIWSPASIAYDKGCQLVIILIKYFIKFSSWRMGDHVHNMNVLKAHHGSSCNNSESDRPLQFFMVMDGISMVLI